MVARLPKQGPQARLSEGGTTSIRAVIASSIFIVLFAVALLLGGRAAIAPFLHPADANDPRAVGEVVVTMPDGKFCRHMSFDNATASIIEGTIEPCRTDISRDFGVPAVAPHGGFAWGTR